MDDMRSAQLQQKLALLESVSDNTKIMIRFAEKRNLKGLNRLSRERGAILEKLVALNASLTMQKTDRQEPVQLLQQIKETEREIVADNEKLMDAAYAARKAVCDDMRRLQQQRTVWTMYDLQGIKMAGRRINYYK